MMHMKAMLRFAAFVPALLFSTLVVQAQVATGTYPYGTFDTPGIDTINVGNLNVHLTLPILNKAGRGLPFYYNMSYDSSVWVPTGSSGSMQWEPVQNWGWRGQTEITTGYISDNPISVVCSTTTVDRVVVPNGWRVTIYDAVYHDPWGAAHPFAGSSWIQTSTCGSPTTGGTIGPLATDGSGYSYVPVADAAAKIADKSGKVFSVPIDTGTGSASAVDTNGNEVTVNGSGQFTDTTGNVVLTVAGTAPSPETFVYTDTNGNSQTVTMTYATYTVQTAFGCSGVGEYGPTSTSLVHTISYPDGITYTLSYEATPGVSGNVTGRVASVELPQGGTIDYTYSGGSNGIECADGSTAGLTRALASSSGSAASTWSYSRTAGTGTSSTTVVDGLGNHKLYSFVEASNQPAGATAAYYETNRTLYEGAASGTAGLVRNTCYNGAASPCTTTIPTLPFSQIDTYQTLNGLETNGSTTMFNTYGMQTEAETWDYASGTTSRGSLLRKEVWTYGYSIASLPTEDEVYDGTGDVIGKTLYTYDGATPTPSSGVPQHVAATGPRGNLTNETVYASASTSYALSATYEDTGSLLTSVTPNGTTTLSYDSTFVYNTGVSQPTPSSGVAISTGQAYDTTNTGLPLTSTDPNSQVTTVNTYDALLRPTKISYPDLGVTQISYPTPGQTSNWRYQNSTNYVDTETLLDGYGRMSRTAVSNGQGTNPWYLQDSCYDANGNLSFQSYPYQAASLTASKVCSGAGDQYTYGVLGRMTNMTRGDGETRNYSYQGRASQSVDENGVTRISQVDGLGRPTIVCEISSNTYQGASPTSCGMDLPGTGFTTTYSYTPATGTTTVTQGAQTRTFQSDWLGRPTLVQEPERGQTTYSYAYNSTGLLVDRVRPEPNQTSSSTTTLTATQYDSLGRVLTIAYSNSSATKAYTYDASAGADFTDLTQTNLKGRVSLAYIVGSTNLMTAYSYDAMGRTTALDSCFPSTPCGTVANNRQQHYTYDLAGNMLTSTDSGGVTSTYTYSTANELQTLTSSLNNSTNPPNIISGMQNTPHGPTSYNLGNGVSEVYNYDTLGRFDGEYVCTGSTSIYCAGGSEGYALTNTWKGTQLTSECDSAFSQCISYGYDEFNRLSSRTVTSGTSQNYTYGYDRYGNRWSQTLTAGSGPTSSISFNSATNQINTSGYTYDAAGNMTNDGFHAYKYDAEGNIVSVDAGSTASYSYDALNHRGRSIVASGLASTVTEFVYNAAGQRATIWNGNTKAVIQGQYYWGTKHIAYYLAGGAVNFQHQDWTGSEQIRTNSAGIAEETDIYLPFGDGFTAEYSDTDPYHYSMLDHDYETDTEHTQFRQYSSAQGRFLSPDPYGGSYDPSNPQSFNRYAYALNNPLSNVDPSGLTDDGGCPQDQTCIDGGDPEDGGNGGCSNCTDSDPVKAPPDDPPPSTPPTVSTPYQIYGIGFSSSDIQTTSVTLGTQFPSFTPVVFVPSSPSNPPKTNPNDPYFVARCQGGGLFLTKYGCPYLCEAVEVGAFPSIMLTIGAISFSPKQITQQCPTGAAEMFCPNSVIVEGNVNPSSGATSNTKILSCHN
jgi:RHS repeat-associated protein